MHSLESKVTHIVELWGASTKASKYQDLANKIIEEVADLEDKVQTLTRERDTAYKKDERAHNVQEQTKAFLKEIAESHHQQCYLVDRFACVNSCIGCQAEELLKKLG